MLPGRNSSQTLAAGVEHSAHFGDDLLGRFVGEAEIPVDLNLMIILAGVCDNLDLTVKAGECDIDTAGIADEQRELQTVLQLADGRADGRLLHARNDYL